MTCRPLVTQFHQERAKNSIKRQEVNSAVKKISKFSERSDTHATLEKVADEISKLRELESLRAQIDTINATIKQHNYKYGNSI